MHAQLAINDAAVRVDPHPAGACGVIGRGAGRANVLAKLFIGLRLCAWCGFYGTDGCQ